MKKHPCAFFFIIPQNDTFVDSVYSLADDNKFATDPPRSQELLPYGQVQKAYVKEATNEEKMAFYHSERGQFSRYLIFDNVSKSFVHFVDRPAYFYQTGIFSGDLWTGIVDCDTNGKNMTVYAGRQYLLDRSIYVITSEDNAEKEYHSIAVSTAEKALTHLKKSMVNPADYESRLQCIGEIIKFGSYEQDNNLENGNEPIKWVILKTENNKCLLLSAYIIEYGGYHGKTIAEECTWKTSTLRNWLNTAFLNNAFTKEEQEKILSTIIQTNDGTDVYDRVFILSIEDTELFFKSRKDLLQATGTEYAKMRGLFVSEDNGYSAWWLVNDYPAMHLFKTSIDTNGNLYNGPRSNEGIGIRPAIWVLSSIIAN